MTRKAIGDKDITLGNFCHKGVFKWMVILIGKWNRIIDIMNGRDNEYYSPENGRAYQEELLDTLTWFSKWKKDHDERVKNGSRTEYIFLLQRHGIVFK